MRGDRMIPRLFIVGLQHAATLLTASYIYSGGVRRHHLTHKLYRLASHQFYVIVDLKQKADRRGDSRIALSASRGNIAI